jgi:branched-chain amino acid transport system substrate-binding protein
MTKRLTLLPALIVTLALVGAGCGGDDDDGGGDGGGGDGGGGGETLQVGYAASQTGRLAIFEEPLLEGLQAQIDAINADGGADGVQIELEVRDCASDPQRCGVAAQELIDGGAQVLISPCDVDASLPAAQIAQRDQVPIINSCGSGSSFREQVGDFAFLNVYGTVAEGQAMAELASDDGHTTAGMMTSSDIEYTESIIDAASERFEELGGQVVETQQFKLDQPRYSSQATALANANPDVIMTSMFLPAANTFLQNLRAAGYDGPVIGPDGMQGDEIFAAGNAARDVTVAGFAIAGTEDGDLTQAFIDMFTEQTGSEPPSLAFSALGADIALTIQAGVTAAGSTDPPAIRDAIDELEDVQGATGEYSYAGLGGIPDKQVVFVKTNVETDQFDFLDRFVPEAVQEGSE